MFNRIKKWFFDLVKDSKKYYDIDCETKLAWYEERYTEKK